MMHRLRVMQACLGCKRSAHFGSHQLLYL